MPDARYVAYVVAQDDQHAGSAFEGCNLQAAVTSLRFRTRDASPPLFLAASPIVAPLPGAEGAAAVKVTATLDEPGTVWVMAVPEGAAPSLPSLSSLLLHGTKSAVRASPLLPPSLPISIAFRAACRAPRKSWCLDEYPQCALPADRAL